MSCECRNAHSNPSFFRYEIIKLPDKILMENCLFISKYHHGIIFKKLFHLMYYVTFHILN